MKKLTEQELIQFEEKVANIFNEGKIRSPIHLYAGNEAQMIKVFEEVSDDDWVLCSWRSHYQCLLKGVPEEQLLENITSGKSISLCFEEYKVISSAIVTGILPIAVGLAADIKRNRQKNKVFCFMGDMTSESGMAYECIKYSRNYELPIKFIIEDNGKSVCTDTRKTWNTEILNFENVDDDYVKYYKYDFVKYPHAGSGKRIQF